MAQEDGLASTTVCLIETGVRFGEGLCIPARFGGPGADRKQPMIGSTAISMLARPVGSSGNDSGRDLARLVLRVFGLDGHAAALLQDLEHGVEVVLQLLQHVPFA